MQMVGCDTLVCVEIFSCFLDLYALIYKLWTIEKLASIFPLALMLSPLDL